MVTMQKRSNIKTGSVLLITSYLFLLFSTVNNTGTSISSIGTMLLATILATTNFLFVWHIVKNKEINKNHLFILVFSVIFTALLVIGSLNQLTSRGLITFGQFMLLIGFTLSTSLIRWNLFRIKFFASLASIFILFHFLIWASRGFESFFSSIYLNSNIIGPYMLFTSFYVIWAKNFARNKLLYNIVLVFSVLLLFASDTRSAMLAGVIAFLTYILWKFISRTKFVYISFILVVFSILLLSIFAYPYLPYWEHFGTLNDLAIQYTGKRLMSGREDIWLILISIINEHPILGHGTGILPRDVLMDFELSSHNLYIQVALQNGYLGLSVLFLILLSIWCVFWKSRNDKTVRLVASFFIAILVHQMFEVSLTQNQLGVGLMQWFIISIGISHVINSKREVS